MKEGWEYREFERCLIKVPKQKAVKSKDYLEEGKCPIVSQESYLISGYTNDESIIYKHEKPVVIFGDHTKNVKYVPFDFVVGADGVHILLTKEDILPKFFYYELCSIKLRDLGYARHYKLLKEKSVGIPPLPEQERIVALLDKQFEYIDILKNNAEHQLQAAKDLFQAALKELLTPKEGWEKKQIRCCASVQNGYAFDSKLFNNIKEGKPLIRIRDIKKSYSDTYTNEQCNKDYEVHNGDLLIGMDGDFNVAIWQGGDALLNQRVCKVIPKTIELKYLYYYLPFPLKEINEKTPFATVKHLSSKQVLDIYLSVPSLPEQQRIASRLDAISEKVKTLQANYDQTINLCNDLKQSLLKSIFA